MGVVVAHVQQRTGRQAGRVPLFHIVAQRGQAAQAGGIDLGEVVVAVEQTQQPGELHLEVEQRPRPPQGTADRPRQSNALQHDLGVESPLRHLDQSHVNASPPLRNLNLNAPARALARPPGPAASCEMYTPPSSGAGAESGRQGRQQACGAPLGHQARSRSQACRRPRRCPPPAHGKWTRRPRQSRSCGADRPSPMAVSQASMSTPALGGASSRSTRPLQMSSGTVTTGTPRPAGRAPAASPPSPPADRHR
jgi:hypothetical protein